MSRPPALPVDGLLNVAKPAGMTSFDVVARVRRVYATKRAGHAGTLDPDATGVLVIALGQATRLLPYLPTEPKIYVARIGFGLATDTEDAGGKPVATADASALTFEQLQAVLPRFTGAISQVPPMVSALHHEGRRLYDLAREGITVEREARPVTIHEIAASDFAPGERASATLRVVCGGGTYIRTLCADMGAALGLPAHMTTLVRHAVGPFTLAGATPLDTLLGDISPGAARALVLPMEAALPGLPTVDVTNDDAGRLDRGQTVGAMDTTDPAASGLVLLLHRGHLRALARRDGNQYHPFRVFPAKGDADTTDEN